MQHHQQPGIEHTPGVSPLPERPARKSRRESTDARLLGGSKETGRSRGAYTLVEVMIGLGIFAILATSLAALTFMVRAWSEENVYNTMTLAMAQSYMEQLRGVAYPTLQSAADSSSTTIPLLNAEGVQVTDTAGRAIYNNDTNWAEETVYLDQDAAGHPIQPMTFRFRLSLTDLAQLLPRPGNGGTPVDGIEVVLTYQCDYNFGAVRSYNGTFRSVISAVPSY